MANHTSTLAIKLLDGISGPAKGAAASLGAITKATEAIGKVKGFREQTQRLEELTRAHAKAREGVRNLAGQLMAAEAPSQKMKAAYERATQAADKLGNKLEWQKARVRGAASELERMGVSANNLVGAENRLQSAVMRTTAALQRQEAAALRSQARRAALGDAATIAGGIAAHQGVNIAKKAIVSAANFDIGVRQQRNYAGISKEEQDKLLIPQAKRIGQDTQFSNLDIVEAQTAIMQRLPEQLPRAAVAQAITEEVKNYALSMKADMKTSAEGITAYLMQTGKDISTQTKAVAEARRASNMLVKMAKIGGMNDEDVQQFMKYSATSATLAGLSNETLGALGVGLKRAGFRGDEAGVGIRSISSKLVSPGRKGLDALTAMGVDYNKFTTMPGGLSAENLEAMQKRRFGKTFSEDQRTRLQAVMEDGDVVGNKDEFIAQVSAIMNESFEKTKGGKTKAQDAQKIAKLAADFHQLGVASVDAEGLLAAILSASPTLQQLNALLTDKQGGKGGALAKALEQLGRDRESLKNTPDDFSKKIADDIMAGLGGSFERLKGSVENFYQAIGEANSKLLTFSFDKIGNFIDGVSNLGETARQAATAVAAAGAVFGAYRSAGLISALIRGVSGGGAGAALTSSALALDGSAAALTRAAFALGAKDVSLPGDGGKPKPKGGVGALLGGATLTGSVAAGTIAAATAIIINDHKPAQPGVTKSNALPGQEHDDAQRRRKAFNAAQHQRFLEERRQLGAIPEQGETAGTDAGTRLGSGMAAGMRAQRGVVEAEAGGVYNFIKGLFGKGVDVPVRLNPNGVPSSPAVPAPKSTDAKVSSVRGGNVSVVVNTGSGDPNEIANAVSRKVAESAREAMRGDFSENT